MSEEYLFEYLESQSQYNRFLTQVQDFTECWTPSMFFIKKSYNNGYVQIINEAQILKWEISTSILELKRNIYNDNIREDINKIYKNFEQSQVYFILINSIRTPIEDTTQGYNTFILRTIEYIRFMRGYIPLRNIAFKI